VFINDEIIFKVILNSFDISY
jgi:hypothetical protein